jgi:hypothetical protein
MMSVWIALAAVVASQPANLVIVYGTNPPTVVRYSSLDRCERAKRALLEQAEQQGVNQGSATSGMIDIHRGIAAYCIPA